MARITSRPRCLPFAPLAIHSSPCPVSRQHTSKLQNPSFHPGHLSLVVLSYPMIGNPRPIQLACGVSICRVISTGVMKSSKVVTMAQIEAGMDGSQRSGIEVAFCAPSRLETLT
jgi:hypothetical protein